jgi:putative transposase
MFGYNPVMHRAFADKPEPPILRSAAQTRGGSRARKRPKDAPTFVASFPLEVTAAQRAEITKRFDVAGRLYNACLGEARKRAKRMRADPRWEQAMALDKGPERTARFRELRTEYAFSDRDLMSFASGCRVAWLRDKVFGQEAQVLGKRAYDAVNDWLVGRRGKPRFKKVQSRGLHSLECKDLRSTMAAHETADSRAGLRWGMGMILPFRLDESDPYQWWAACHVADDRLLRCRIVRSRINGRWAFTAQLVLAGHPLHRYETGTDVIGVDLGPSEIAVVGDTSAYKERFCDELADHDREIRRLQRRLDRQHRAASPGCFDEKGGAPERRVRLEAAVQARPTDQYQSRRCPAPVGRAPQEPPWQPGQPDPRPRRDRQGREALLQGVPTLLRTQRRPACARDVHDDPCPQGCECRRASH